MDSVRIRRLAGWAVVAAVVVGTAGAGLAERWGLAVVGLAGLTGAQTALLYQQRVRDGRRAQQTRQLFREQRGLAGLVRSVSGRLHEWGDLVAEIREHDRRVMGVLETERRMAEQRAEELERRLRRVEATLARSADEPPDRSRDAGERVPGGVSDGPDQVAPEA
ncbi:hypothetical protein Q9R32_09545 [Actinotalea sp. AC32]|nr:hypothetical protein [Actinotalea sp. AC32]